MLLALFDSDGVWRTGADDIEMVVHNYFGGIFSSSSPNSANFCSVTNSVAPRVFSAMNRLLDAKFSALEVQMALKQMHHSKAPDMSKAYDRVEWGFLESMMVKLGFSSSWIGKIMYCVSLVSYSYLLNGEVRGSLKPSRGLRQGNPLSPYLFLLSAEGLSSLLSTVEMAGHIHGLGCGRGGPSVSHLFFIDGSLLFLRAIINECLQVSQNPSLASSSSQQPLSAWLFLWHVCKEWLLMASILVRRHIISSEVCPICNSGFESVMHAIWGCPCLKPVRKSRPEFATLPRDF
ncbi:hypothetical protein ACOSQ3_012942 [Xanthoceras sorbifolium]